MKPLAFVPPALALLASGIWLGLQRHSIAGLVEQNELLATNIAKVRSMPRPDERTSSSPNGNGAATSKKAIDWKKVASQVATLRDGSGIQDLRSIMQLRQQLMEMGEQELLQALDEIAALGLPNESRMHLESMVAGVLAEKAPEAFLTRFIDRLGNQRDSLNWQLSNAFSTWAKKDSAAATAWFDQQIAAGAFDSKSLDGKSSPRLGFEGSLIRGLLSSNPEAAENRIAALPMEQRKEALRFPGLSIESEAPAFAELVRKQLPQEDQAKALADAAPVGFSAEYDKITDYLNRISSTSTEREICVAETGATAVQRLSFQREIKAEDFERMREWVAKESPGMMDKTTGKALAGVLNSNQKMKFPEAADLALQYHEKGGGDELLLPLLDNWQAHQNPETARKLAEKISDEKRRVEALQKITNFSR